MINKRIIAVGIVFLMNQFALAQVNEALSQQRGADDGTVMQSLQMPVGYYLNETAELINRVQLQFPTTYQINKTDVADACTAFMDAKQFLGPAGANIFKLVTQNSKDYPFLVRGGDINNYCPKYGRMDIKQKGLVWVMVLTMIAHFEASCKLKAYAKGPNGTAQGYYQLHKGKESDYTDSKGACPKNASLSVNQSNACMLAMLDDQLETKQGKLFSPKSYWDVLRPQGRSHRAKQIGATLKRSSLCNPTAM